MRKAVYTVTALLLPLVLCACGPSAEELQRRAIGQLNRNSDLPFSLTLPETELGDVSAYSRGDDVFVHSSALKAADIRFLNENDIVEFDEEVRNGKLSVTTINLLRRDEEAARRFQERRAQFRNRDDGMAPRRGGFAFWKK